MKIGADRQGFKKFLTPLASKVRVGELLGDLEADYRLRKVKSRRALLMATVTELGPRLGIAPTCSALGVAPGDLLPPTPTPMRPATTTIASPQR